MEEGYNNMERKGLPGGPNEVFTYVTGVFSTDGYKRNSPDVGNPFNIINSGNITMEDVDFPVMGTDNLGNSQMMLPGNDYQFPGNSVFEIPMAKKGASLSKIRNKPGMSNAGKYPNVKDFAGPHGTYPINSIDRARSALKLAHHSNNPGSIKSKVYAKYPSLRKSQDGGQNNLPERNF